MGIGVAQSAAEVGYRVTLVDHDDRACASAKVRIRQNLRLKLLLKQSGDRTPLDQILDRITTSSKIDDLFESGIVVENIVEDWADKKPLYRAMDAICVPSCIFAANTSAIPITRIGGATLRPDRVLGAHFMNPVPLKDAVEIIRGVHTSQATLEIMNDFIVRMGMRSIVVNDSPGFVSNRVLMLTINEAINLVHEGVATADTVDDIFTSCFGHKMGPLATADLIGLDTILQSLDVLYDNFKDPKFRPSILLARMVDAGFFGQKSGKGFFEYGQPLAEQGLKVNAGHGEGA